MITKKTTLPVLALIVIVIAVAACSCSSNTIELDGYKVIFSAGDGDIATKAALDISTLIDAKLEKDVSFEAGEKEILIGNTNRPESVAGSADLLRLDYAVKAVGGKIVICGGSDRAIADGTKWFIENCVSDGKAKVNDYIYRHEYSVKSMTVSGNSIKSFNVISTATDSSYDSFKADFEERFSERTGYRLMENADALNIMIKCDSTLAPDSYLIKIATGDITISGANAYGINAAIDHFFDTVLTSNTVLNDGDVFTGLIPEQTLKYTNYINRRTPLKTTYERLSNEKELNIVYYGGSVTSGHGASDSNSTSWRALTADWFDITFPDAKINHYNSSVGGSGSMLGAFRAEHDVNALEPDLVFIEFAINDVYCGTDPEDVKLYYESTVRQIKEKNPDCDIIALYVTDQSNARNSQNGYYTQALAQEAIAQHYKLPSIYLGGALCSLFDYTSDDEWAKYFIDIVHPTDNGYAVYFDVIKEFLESELVHADTYGNDIVYGLPEKLTEEEFAPQFILPNQMQIVENINWEIASTSYWNTANPYEGYLYPTSADNKLTVRFTGNNA
ncbi:MAG: SGNH/GDSL hydrolase family protein, partial [Clostridia bacterium]|nr:SGNH/GDSL hydrolase family protein [Clostridia bacterium]